MKKTIAFSIVAILTLASVSVRTAIASADEVLHFTFPLDIVSTSNVCGFPVQREESGVLRETIRLSASGRIVDQIEVSDYRITFTNLVNGKSIWTTRGLMERDTFYTDGTDVHFEAGLVSHLVVPGEGLVATNTGTITAVFDSNGDLVSFELLR